MHSIVATLAEQISAAEFERLKRRPAANMAVYDLILRAYHHLGIWTKEDYLKAQELLQRAVDLDPDCAQAHAMLAWCCTFLMWFGGDEEALLKLALESGNRALKLDPRSSEAHSGLGWAHYMSGRHEPGGPIRAPCVPLPT